VRRYRIDNRRHGWIWEWRMFGHEWYASLAFPGFRKRFEITWPTRVRRK
jgi:hypothetical protein